MKINFKDPYEAPCASRHGGPGNISQRDGGRLSPATDPARIGHGQRAA